MSCCWRGGQIPHRSGRELGAPSINDFRTILGARKERLQNPKKNGLLLPRSFFGCKPFFRLLYYPDKFKSHDCDEGRGKKIKKHVADFIHGWFLRQHMGHVVDVNCFSHVSAFGVRLVGRLEPHSRVLLHVLTP